MLKIIVAAIIASILLCRCNQRVTETPVQEVPWVVVSSSLSNTNGLNNIDHFYQEYPYQVTVEKDGAQRWAYSKYDLPLGRRIKIQTVVVGDVLYDGEGKPPLRRHAVLTIAFPYVINQ